MVPPHRKPPERGKRSHFTMSTIAASIRPNESAVGAFRLQGEGSAMGGTVVRAAVRTGLVAAAMLAMVGAVQAQTKVSIGLVQEPPGLDPTVRTAAVINYVSMMNIFEGLTKLNEDGTYSPNLAESWEISPDGKTYTFHLLQGVKFADGSDFTSEDVKWTFERNAAPDSQNNNKKYFELMERIETPDPYTV